MDGCNRLGVLPRIRPPLSVPGLVAVGVIAFSASWNAFLFAPTLIIDDGRHNASPGTATLMTELDTHRSSRRWRQASCFSSCRSSSTWRSSATCCAG